MNNMKTNHIFIKTPEGIVFPLLIAGPVIRSLAYAIDIACIIVVYNIIVKFISLFNIVSLDIGRAFSVIVNFIVSIGYGIIAEWYWQGQTLGKRLIRLRVMDKQGLRLQFSQIVIRNLLRVIDALPVFYLVGGIAALANQRGQRLGDLAANTIVVRNPLLTEPDLDQLGPIKFNSLRQYPHLNARLRKNVSLEESFIALQALLRRNELDARARVELFAEIAEHFRSIVEFPPEAVEGISDEQYVCNIADILYKR